jgi:hypothetical protein
MPKYTLRASVSWASNSTINFGEEEYDTIEEAQEAALESAVERLDVWAELVDEEKE